MQAFRIELELGDSGSRTRKRTKILNA